MRLAVLCVFLSLCATCDPGPAADRQTPTPQPAPGRSAAPAAAAPASSAVIAFPIRIEGRGFADANGKPFPWRGITSFQLAEMIAGGREQEAVAYLDWAAS